MNRWVLYTAIRQFKTKRKEKGDSSTFLSIIGIISGVMTMITVIGIMNGFQGTKIDQRIEIVSGHIVLEPKNQDIKLDEKILTNLSQTTTFYKSSELVTAVSSGMNSSIGGIQVNSLPENIYKIDNAFKYWVPIIDGEFNISDNRIVIGQSLAYRRNLTVGDVVTLLSLKNDSNNKFRPEQIEFKISGVFRTGSINYNENLVFISNNNSLKYFANTDEFVYKIKINNRNRYQNYVNELMKSKEILEQYNIKSWRDFNKSYFSALKNEKNLMTILIGLIFLVVGINIYNSLRRSVYLRFIEISVLKTMGATSTNIKNIFILQSFFIGVIGGTLGILLGLFVAHNINPIFGLLQIVFDNLYSVFNRDSVSLYGSQYFFLNQVPVEIYLEECIFVFISAMLTSIIAAYVASKKISAIKPGEVIRNE